MKNLELINKLLFGIFALFLLFSAIVIFVANFMTSPLLSFIIFIVILYILYYILLKFLIKE